MSYHITISGHVAHDVAEEAAKVEQEIAQKAREFVAALPGVSGANAGFQHIGAQDLKVAP
jgi:hypothetical protein